MRTAPRSGRLRRLLAAGALAATALAFAPGRAAAYDPEFTHRWIARQAVQHLRALYPGRYDEILTYLETFIDGVQEEDNVVLDGDTDPLTLRVMRHFYRPTDAQGLAYGGRTFPSSYAWGALPNAENAYGWDDAVRLYQSGDKQAAYFALGHVVHLIQDATVPAHTHLDIHGPPSGDTYESYCSSQMTSDMSGDLPLPAPDAAIPEFATLEDAWQRTARASYDRNLYPGALSDPAVATATGVLRDMFPTVQVGWTDQAWFIPGVGQLGTAFWQDAPGEFYFKIASGVAAVDRIGFSVDAPDHFTFAANVDQRPMAARMADDLIPIAILHSAGLLKKFMDDAQDLSKPDPEPDPMTSADQGGCQMSHGAGAAPLGLTLLALAIVRRRSRRSRLGGTHDSH